MRDQHPRRIAVVGLGYVGLPMTLAMAARFAGVLGYDTNSRKVAELRAGVDRTREVSETQLTASSAVFTDELEDLRQADFYIVAVPTPIDATKTPDLSALRAATEMLAPCLAPGDIVVYESTVYPGVTEEICAPILSRNSGFRAGVDFGLGYSPERINPGDPDHTFSKIVKVVSASDDATLDIVADIYSAVVEAGVFRASSIRVAEASKVIENVQRDLNIALMNELAQIFDRLGIDTCEVLDAAATKWNFARFHPGLVGGHCIGVDPYYLTAKAQQVGITPQVILAGRRINDGMGEFVAQRTIKQLILAGRPVQGARIGVLGITFKEDVRDIRNSRVPDIVTELADYRAQVLVHDPLADPEETLAEYGISLVEASALSDLDAVVLAVPHRDLVDLCIQLCHPPTRVLVDVRGIVPRDEIPSDVSVWRL